MRLHSAPSQSRLPWKFGDEAEKVAKSFLLMRRSLAPTLIAAARQVSIDGTPLARRCDLIWPQYATEGASSSAQYMLGDDLLVRPIDPFDGVPAENASIHTYKPAGGVYNRDATVWLPPGEWHDAFSGRVLNGGANVSLEGLSVEHMPLFHRGGSLVVTASEGGAGGWKGLVAHIWPNRAVFDGALAVGELAPPLERLVYAPSLVDESGSSTPVARIRKREYQGRIDVDFEISNLSSTQEWVVRLHVPVERVDATTIQMYCDDSLTIAMDTRAPRKPYVPFVDHHAPPESPNVVLEGNLTVSASVVRRCTFTRSSGIELR
eukprot:SAG31_NODE_5902_length_2264_cov_2.222633_2_plen_320_part_00